MKDITRDEALVRVKRAIDSLSTSADRAITDILSLGVDIVDAQEGSLLLANSENDLTFRKTVGVSRGKAKQLYGQIIPAGEGIVGLALSTEQPQSSCPTYHSTEQLGRRPDLVVAAPFFVYGHACGVITAVVFKSHTSASQRVLSSFSRCACLCGSLIESLVDGSNASSPSPLLDTGEMDEVIKGKGDFIAAVNHLRELFLTYPSAMPQCRSVLKSLLIMVRTVGKSNKG